MKSYFEWNKMNKDDNGDDNHDDVDDDGMNKGRKKNGTNSAWKY